MPGTLLVAASSSIKFKLNHIYSDLGYFKLTSLKKCLRPFEVSARLCEYLSQLNVFLFVGCCLRSICISQWLVGRWGSIEQNIGAKVKQLH